MRSVIAAVIAYLLIFFGQPASASQQEILVDFNSLSRGEVVTGQFTSDGVVFRAANWSSGPDAAVVFDTNNIGASDDTDLQAPLDPAAGFETYGELSPGNVLILHERNDCTNALCAEPDDESSRRAGWVEFEFAVPVILHGMKLIDINYEADEPASQLVLYDADGEILESIDIPGVGRQGDWQPWSLERSGVSRARLYLPGDGAIDDLAFTPQQTIDWEPTFASHPPVAVSPDAIYQYLPDVGDRDGQPLSVHLVSGPPGMIVSENNEITWTPGGIAGAFPVEIEARDGAGGSVTQAFVIHSEERVLHTQDFEFDAGTIIDEELAADGLLVRAHNESKGPDFVVVFDSELPTGNDGDLAAPFPEGSDNDLGLGAMQPGKILILHETHDCDPQERVCAEPDDESSSPAGWIEFKFTQPVHVWSLDVFDITSDDPAARSVKSFDSDDQVLATHTLPRTGGNEWDRLVIDTQGVRRLRVHLDGDGAFKNLRYALVGSAKPENRPPVINDEEFEILKDQVLTIAAPGVLANDHDPDGDEITAVLDDEPWHGTVVLNPDGSFVYTPAPGFVGKDEFEYRVRDAESASPADDVEVYVLGEPDEPDEPEDPEPGLAPVIELFGLDKTRIYVGDSALLSWAVTGATHVEVNGAVVPSSGSLTVAPTITTSYAISAVSPEGVTAGQAVTLTVNEPTWLNFLVPEEGALESGPRPRFTLEFLSPTGGINPSYLFFQYEGANMDATCTFIRFDRLSCWPDNPLPEGSATFTAFMNNGTETYSNVAVRTFQIDSTPPYTPNVALITVGKPDAMNQVAITGLQGAIEPGAIGRLRFNDTFHDLPVNPDGSFESVFTAAAGTRLDIFAIDAAGLTSPYAVMHVPQPAPVLAIAAPTTGAILNSNQPEIVIGYQQTGSGLDMNTLLLTKNESPLAIVCAHTEVESRCIPESPLDDGVVVLAATISDTDGAASNIATTTFIVDTLPPSPVDRGKITLVQEPAGMVTISGAGGAAEPGATVEIANGTQTITIAVDSMGAFSSAIDGNTGETISIVVVDPAGNVSAIEEFEVLRPPIAITVTSPTDGATAGGLASVKGHHNGPANTGVLINGLPAIVDSAGNFLIANLPLSEGLVQIDIAATSSDGRVGSESISVNSDGSRPSLALELERPEGFAPLTTHLVSAYGGTSDITLIEIDVDGDGQYDLSTAGPSIDIEFTYQDPGIYLPKLRLHTSEGILEASNMVEVLDRSQIEARMRAIWSELVTAILAEDSEAALSTMTRQAANRYQILFETIGDELKAGAAEYSQPVVGQMESGVAELLISRPYQGETLWYLVTFVRDTDGVWRISSL